jgi:hypothetical protein
MGEMEPHVVFPPLAIVGIDASSIGIEYLQEHLIREMVDCPVRRPICILIGALTCGKSVGWVMASQLVDVLLLISGLHGVNVTES